MADIPTVILGLTKPLIDVEDPNQDWGDKLNDNFDTLDSKWASVLPQPLTLGSAGSAGTDTRVARADHVHPMTTSLPPLPGLGLLGDLDMNGFDILEWLDASITPAAAGATATGGRNRIAQILNQIKTGFGLTNWFDNATGLLTRITANEAAIVTLQSTDTTHSSQITALQAKDATHDSQITALQTTDTTQNGQIATLQSGLSAIDRLRVTAQSTPGTTLAVAAGVYTKSDGSATVTFAGGNSPAFAVVTANSRIDLLTIDDTGTVGITQGVQAASPVPPAYPSTKIVLAEVTISQTTGPAITQAMIKDVRPYLNLGSGGGSSSASLEYVAYTVGTPTGAYSGSTTVFDLPFSYATNGKTIEVYYNGQQLKFGTDYSETSATRITMTSALISGAAVWFRAVTSASAIAPSVVTLYREDYIVGTALNTYSGSLTVFALGNTFNVGGNALMVTLDGDVQTKGASADYLETNSNTVTFNTALVVGQRVSFIWASSAPSSAVSAGTAGQLAYYPASSGVVSGTPNAVVNPNGSITLAKSLSLEETETDTVYNGAITGNAGALIVGKTGYWGLRQATDHSINVDVYNNGTPGTALKIKQNGSVGIAGTPTNDNAPSGYVGQFIQAIGAGTPAVNNTWVDATSITLPPGDWDITVNGWGAANGAAVTVTWIGIGTVSGNTSPGGVGDSSSLQYQSYGTNNQIALSVPCYRASIAVTTTFYLKGYMTFTTATPNFGGRISARRIR